MRSRTLFYPEAVRGQGTGDAQSLRSYIEALALQHQMKPRALLQILFASYPLDELSMNLHPLMKRWDVHGFAALERQLRPRLEAATGMSLAGSTLARFKGLFSSMNLVRANDPMYCPLCVLEDEELPYGRLAWEVQCVVACPRHGVVLRSEKVCGDSPSARLPIVRRPALRGVCMQCGSVGFRCVSAPTEPASEESVWIANQVRLLLEMTSDELSACSADALRSGLKSLVASTYGGSAVRASLDSGLSRASVSTWIAGKFLPGLPWLLQLCYNAGADIRSLIGGPFRLVAEQLSSDGPSLRAVPRNYERSALNRSEIASLLVDAASMEDPPTIKALARQHGLHPDTTRHRCPAENALLAKASLARLSRMYEGQFNDSARAYKTAAQALVKDGQAVHARSVQERSGLVAFGQNRSRVRALQKTLANHGRVRKKQSPAR